MQDNLRLINTFIPKRYNLSLDIDREKRTFEGVVIIDGRTVDGAVALHSKDLEINTVNIDGTPVNWSMDENDSLTLQFRGEPSQDILITIGFSGKITDSMHGMYPCYFEHAGEKKEWIATQFESHHAREVFPCVDEPEAKASYSLTLTTESGITVLGNMPVKSQSEVDGRLTTTFDDTPIMSSYLLAWVYGEMHRKTAKTKDGVEVNVWATLAQRPESLDFALDHAVKSIEFFNDYFDTPYPLPKCDNIALPDFSSGAMENWGLVTYRETALLADPITTTVSSKQYIATVISHELSHQWFGNLVTMKWWNNLWLNESFATLMEYIAVDAIHPEWNAWLDFATNESILALRRDAIEGVQSVQVEVNHPDEISTLFDGAIVYAKGARLMRMCQSYIGEEAFRQGLASYFKDFAYKNTEADDLWHHLSKSSGKDISGLMNIWISQSGYPVVKVSDNEVSQEQFFIGTAESSDQLWPIPLSPSDSQLPDILGERKLEIELPLGARLNDGDSSHFITYYSDKHLASLLKLVENGELDELSRLQLLHEQTLLARAGVLPSSRLIKLLESYRHETAESVWNIIALALGELKKFVETDEQAELALKKLSGQLAKSHYDKLGWYKSENDSLENIKLRGLVLGMMVYSDRPEVIAKADEIFNSGPIESIDPEIRSLVISSVLRRTDDRDLVKQLVKLHQTTQSADLRDDLCAGLTSVKNQEDIKYLLGLFTDIKTIKPQDLARWFVYLLRNRYAREATWQWLRNNWQFIEQQFAGDKSYDYFVVYTAGGLVSAKQLAEYRTFFEPIKSQPALKRVIELGEKEIQARVALIERDQPIVIEALKQID